MNLHNINKQEKRRKPRREASLYGEERKTKTEGEIYEISSAFAVAITLSWTSPSGITSLMQNCSKQKFMPLQPDVQWKVLEPEFPRLALLARRFLSISPTSAPSERVWSRFSCVISKQSSTIDSTIAAQIMFLRDNELLLKSVNPFDPNS